MNQLGSGSNPRRRRLTRLEIAKGYELRRVVVRYAYPRNGNSHNPTPEYRWELYLNGVLVDSCGKLHDLLRGIDGNHHG